MANQERMFRVLVIAISLKNNGIAHSKDEVAESLFSAPIAELVSGGYIEELTDSKDEVAESKPKADDSKKQVTTDLKDIANSIPGANKTSDKK